MPAPSNGNIPIGKREKHFGHATNNEQELKEGDQTAESRQRSKDTPEADGDGEGSDNYWNPPMFDVTGDVLQNVGHNIAELFNCWFVEGGLRFIFSKRRQKY